MTATSPNTTTTRSDAETRDTPVSIKLPSYRHAIWLLPAAYAAHIVEELAGNFPGWVTNDLHADFSHTGFALNNVMFMTVLLTMVYVNYRKTTPLRATILIAFASGNLFWDALFHLFTTPALNRYSPGLITSALLYLPISALIAAVVLKNKILAPRRFGQAITAGLILFGFIVWYGLFHFAT